MGKNKYIINDDSYYWNHRTRLLGYFSRENVPHQLRGTVFHNLFIILFDNITHGAVRTWRD